MRQFIAAISRHLGEAVFAVLPVIPYAPKEKDGCPGLAVSAKQVAASARADGPVAFHDATFEIPCGCRTALIGPNGSGKSTLLRVLAGLTPIRSGEILVAGESPRLGRSRIAYLAQRPHLAESFPLKLRRLVQMGTYAHHGWFEECRHGDEAVDRAMARLGLTELAEILLDVVRPRVAEGLKFLVLLTKADKLTRAEQNRALSIMKLQAGGGEVRLFSATKRQGIDEVSTLLWQWAHPAPALAPTPAPEPE